MRQETFTIEAPRDFELDQDRSCPVTYTITWPDVAPAKGLVLSIGGCGGEGETAEGKCRNIREDIAAETGMAVVSVDYHCIQTRMWNGGSLQVDLQDHLALVGVATVAGLQIDDPQNIGALTSALGALAPLGHSVSAYAKLQPGRGEYQNFGVLQAMDHLAVIGHLFEQDAPFDRTQIFALGGSHGGYIAHLIAKIAPGVLAGIVDNSGYVQPPINYLGMGTEPEFKHDYNGVTLKVHVLGAWSYNDRRDRTFYDRNRDLIRDVGHPPHLQIMASAARDSAMAVAMVNCAVDEIISPEEKQRQADWLNAVGVKTHLKIVQREDIDGVIFKEFVHALALSFKRFFTHYVGGLLEAGARGTGRWGGSVEYPCVDVSYRFSLLPHAPYVTGEVRELFGVDAPQAAAPALAAV